MTAFVEAVEPLLWREGTFRLMIQFFCAYVLVFLAVLGIFKGWWASMCGSLARACDLQLHQCRHLLPIKPPRFRSLKTLIISLAVATLKGNARYAQSHRFLNISLGLSVCFIGENCKIRVAFPRSTRAIMSAKYHLQIRYSISLGQVFDTLRIFIRSNTYPKWADIDRAPIRS